MESKSSMTMTSRLTSALLIGVLAILIAVPRLEARRPISATTRCGAARVAISVSPLVRSKELRVLEISWNYNGARPGDQVALYDYDPVSRRQWDSSRRRNEPITDADAGIGSRGSSNPVDPGSSGPIGLGPSGANGPIGPGPIGLGPSGANGPIGPGPSGLGPSGANGPIGPGPSGAGFGDRPYSSFAPASTPSAYGAYDPYRTGAGQGFPPPPYNDWGGGRGGSVGVGPASYPSPFPVGYPREAFSGRARRQARQADDEDEPQADDAAAAQGPPLAVVPTDGLRSGWRATNVQEKHVPSARLGYTSRCLKYWAVYERPALKYSGNQTEVLAVSCLRTRPTWMSDFRTEIGRLRLVDLFIPGTHDSASIQEDGRNNIIDRYTVTQDESILGQLIYGVRYIDLRVGFYNNKDVQWWANHGPVRMQPLIAVLHDIKAFMDNTNEIVILDIQNFPSGFGKDNKIHLKLVHLLETELGELMAYRDQGQGWVSRLEDMWTGGRRLIVAYDKEDVLPASRKLWPAVRQFWGDAQTPEQLDRYATSILSQQYLKGFAWALMAELTPNARLIATNPTGSLRRLAHLVNRNVTAWAEGQWGEIFNTLAVDFIRSTGVVEAAIFHNLRRGGVDVCNAYRLLDSV